MKMKRTTLILVLAIFAFTNIQLQAQTPGYLGKKNLVSVFTTPSFRFFPAIVGDGWTTFKSTASSSGVSRGIKVGRIDLRFGYIRVLDRQKQLGIEFGYENMVLPTNDYYGGVISSPVFKQYGGFLEYAFTGSSFIAPVGLTYTVGIGPQFYILDRDEPYYYYEDGFGNLSKDVSIFPDYTAPIWSLSGFYQISYRVLLAKFVSLELGIRFKAGVLFVGSAESTDFDENVRSIYQSGYYDPYFDDERPLYNKEDMKNILRSEVSTNLVQFRFGLNIML